MATARSEQSVAGAIVEAYPAAVVAQVYEITSIISLPIERQQTLAQYFHEQDKKANLAKEKGAEPAIIAQFYTLKLENLQKILAPLEYSDYLLSMGQKGTTIKVPVAMKLRTAVRFRKELDLDTSQVNKLLLAGSELEKEAKNEIFNRDSAESSLLKRYLSETQYRNYFVYASVAEAEKSTLDNLEFLRLSDLWDGGDSAALYHQLYTYESERSGGLAFFSAEHDHEGYDRFKSECDYKRPEILIRLDAYRNTYPWSWLLNVMYNGAELKLSQQQKQDIIAAYQVVKKKEHEDKYQKKQKGDEKFDRWQAEKDHLRELLTEKQFNTYLAIRNRDKAKDRALKDWKELIEHQLVKAEDSSKVIDQLADYQLRLAVCNEWLGMEKSKKNEFAKRDVLDNKPELLKKLDEKEKVERESKVVRF